MPSDTLSRRLVVRGAFWTAFGFGGRAAACNPPAAGARAAPLVLSAGAAKPTSGASFAIDDAVYRLTDVLAPRATEDAAGAARAVQTLAAVLARGAHMAAPLCAADRWGRRPVSATPVGAGAEAPAASSVAAALVAAGAARVAPESPDFTRIDALLAAEGDARAARRGGWGGRRWRVLDAGDLDATNAAVGGFHLIEGVVASATTRGRLYINFGEDYRTDVTATVERSVRRRWARAAPFAEAEAYAGRRVRVRGIVTRINGPSIAIRHPAQIEFLP